jgi:hypothetical protein
VSRILPLNSRPHSIFVVAISLSRSPVLYRSLRLPTNTEQCSTYSKRNHIHTRHIKHRHKIYKLPSQLLNWKHRNIAIEVKGLEMKSFRRENGRRVCKGRRILKSEWQNPSSPPLNPHHKSPQLFLCANLCLTTLASNLYSLLPHLYVNNNLCE